MNGVRRETLDVRCEAVFASHLSPFTSHDLYQFPPTRFVSNSLWRQWWHLLSEVIEIGRALLRSDLQHAAAEAWDVKHSAETLHRILAGKGADVEMAREAVISNNLERGYYEPSHVSHPSHMSQGHRP